MTGPLHGLSVWLTRPTASAARSEVAWRDAGAEMWNEPLLELVDRDPDPEQVKAWNARSDYGILLTSARAAQAFARWSGSFTAPVYAVGTATAQTARALGADVRWTASRATGEDLVAEVSRLDGVPPTLVFPASERRRPETVEALEGWPGQWVELTLYRPEALPPSPQALQFLRRDAAVAALYSPSAAHALADVVTAARVVVLGSTTAAAASERGLDVVAVADPPGEPELIAATASWWGATR